MVVSECHGLFFFLVFCAIVALFRIPVELDFLVVDAGVLCAQSLESGIDLFVEVFVEQISCIVFFYTFLGVFRLVTIAVGEGFVFAVLFLDCIQLAVE